MKQPNKSLIAKYNVAAPRYTSYPTVPFWESDLFNPEEWLNHLKTTYTVSKDDGISLYVHLPFCESLCTYCGCNTRITKNHGVETTYINYILREWEMYKAAIDEEIVISEIHLGGGTPTFFEPVNLQRLIVELLNGAIVKEGASFSFEAHPANTTKEHLYTLYHLGFRRLSLGIQDFDPHVQYLINRHQTVEDVQRVMDEAREIGYTSINFDLIYGLPLQTQTTVRDTIEKSLRMSPDRISFYSYAHVPWIKPGQRRFTDHDLPVGEEKLALYILGKQMMEEQGYRDVGMDHFAKPKDELFKAALSGNLHRNFMGYADRYTPVLIGLGVSSISDAWSSFAQNVKNVEDYYKLLDEGGVPLLKGHLLHEEDKVLRRYILDMMCKGKVKLEADFSLNEVIIDRLRPLAGDGLVEYGNSYIKATRIGKSFLRNICMAFDQRLQLSKEQEQLFSQAI
ncbi:oxygen-independent coproporphyrinogen III oxidase [Sphingobacterium sp. SGR-19]|uniref:oxygen-independent coproporphyrinogen III oxidase n=1 Tax=Sphingobacterium sp. SGR-19 TaxID=2710886 RepID=UPI0013EA3BEA|nr:oxygen-independent coproporphyrinogen III oxidase [Sphingobacterium sp. SGR-19]NGM67363.1 oxygen-independent coproporphyrinogen III oxidase [Sphingobacterium sp. SGR-19]